MKIVNSLLFSASLSEEAIRIWFAFILAVEELIAKYICSFSIPSGNSPVLLIILILSPFIKLWSSVNVMVLLVVITFVTPSLSLATENDFS